MSVCVYLLTYLGKFVLERDIEYECHHYGIYGESGLRQSRNDRRT